jgi:cobalt/nickel transport system ATP-binding protein
LIEIKDLTVRYPDGSLALNGVTFSLGNAERCAIAGANGAGKSTLFLALTGLLPIKNGTAILDGTEVTPKNITTVRKKTGLVFQNPDDQLFMPKVYDDIAFGLRNMGLSEDDTKRETLKIAESLNITHILDKNPGRLSGGEKRSAALAGVLALSPKILLLDEPTAFLDPAARRRLINILADIPHTQLIATHDLDMAAALCDKAVLLKDGELLFFGETEAALNDSALLAKADLL